MLEHKATIIFASIIAASIAVGLAAASISAISLGALSPSVNQDTGKINFYLTDAPPSKSGDLKYLLVNVSSIVLRYQNSLPCTTSDSPNDFVFQIPPNTGTNINLTSLVGQSVLLGATNIPQGSVIEVIFMISGAKGFFTDGSYTQLKVVADGKLMMPMHFVVADGGSIDASIDITPNSIHMSNGNQQVLSPVVHITIVDIQGTTNATTISSSFSTTTTISDSGSVNTSNSIASCSSTSETTTITNSPTD
jgi:hypothetical protein